jgi:hypothetical protein
MERDIKLSDDDRHYLIYLLTNYIPVRKEFKIRSSELIKKLVDINEDKK